jgi:peptidoglycan DL-endopeptidase CwlO
VPSGKHARPSSPIFRPSSGALALCAAAVTGVVVTPTAVQAAPTVNLDEVRRVSEARTAAATAAKVPAAKAAAAKKAAVRRPAASARALKAARYARSKINAQYVRGGVGPNRFDCSGLTLAAWRQAGVKLPHRAALQARRGRAVSKAALLPGDLVFFYTAKSHVGLYLGSGRFIHAANPRADVKIDTLTRGYYAKRITAARRIA